MLKLIKGFHYKKNVYFRRNFSHEKYSVENFDFSHGIYRRKSFRRKLLKNGWILPMTNYSIGKLTFLTDYIDKIEIHGKLKFPKIYDEKTINKVGNKIPPTN